MIGRMVITVLLVLCLVAGIATHTLTYEATVDAVLNPDGTANPAWVETQRLRVLGGPANVDWLVSTQIQKLDSHVTKQVLYAPCAALLRTLEVVRPHEGVPVSRN